MLARLDTKSFEIDIERQQLIIEQLKLAREDIASMPPSSPSNALRLAELEVRLAELTLSQMLDELEKSSIVSPIAGEIQFLDKSVNPGSFVNARQMVLSVADTSTCSFVYNGSDATKLLPGMAAEIFMPAGTLMATVVMTPLTAPAEQRELYQDTVILAPLQAGADISTVIGRPTRFKF